MHPAVSTAVATGEPPPAGIPRLRRFQDIMPNSTRPFLPRRDGRCWRVVQYTRSGPCYWGQAYMMFRHVRSTCRAGGVPLAAVPVFRHWVFHGAAPVFCSGLLRCWPLRSFHVARLACWCMYRRCFDVWLACLRISTRSDEGAACACSCIAELLLPLSPAHVPPTRTTLTSLDGIALSTIGG